MRRRPTLRHKAGLGPIRFARYALGGAVVVVISFAAFAGALDAPDTFSESVATIDLPPEPDPEPTPTVAATPPPAVPTPDVESTEVANTEPVGSDITSEPVVLESYVPNTVAWADEPGPEPNSPSALAVETPSPTPEPTPEATAIPHTHAAPVPTATPHTHPDPTPTSTPHTHATPEPEPTDTPHSHPDPGPDPESTPDPDPTSKPEPTADPDPTPDESPSGGPTAKQWAALRSCESGGNYQAVSGNGLYRGAYQFAQGTWNSTASAVWPELVGVDPAKASPADQDKLASRLYDLRGAGPWPLCGRLLS